MSQDRCGELSSKGQGAAKQSGYHKAGAELRVFQNVELQQSRKGLRKEPVAEGIALRCNEY